MIQLNNWQSVHGWLPMLPSLCNPRHLSQQKPTCWRTCYACVDVELIICIPGPAFSRCCIFQYRIIGPYTWHHWSQIFSVPLYVSQSVQNNDYKENWRKWIRFNVQFKSWLNQLSLSYESNKKAKKEEQNKTNDELIKSGNDSKIRDSYRVGHSLHLQCLSNSAAPSSRHTHAAKHIHCRNVTSRAEGTTFYHLVFPTF